MNTDPKHDIFYDGFTHNAHRPFIFLPNNTYRRDHLNHQACNKYLVMCLNPPCTKN